MIDLIAATRLAKDRQRKRLTDALEYRAARVARGLPSGRRWHGPEN